MVNGKWRLIIKEPPKAPPAPAPPPMPNPNDDPDSARFIRDAMGIAAQIKGSRKRSSSSSDSSSSSRRKKKKRKKKHKKKSSSSSTSSKSKREEKETQEKNSTADSSAGAGTGSGGNAEDDSPEIAEAKNGLLKKLMDLKKVEPKEQRMRDFRALLRAWHPDKNPDRAEMATACFQFLQKGKSLMD